MLSLSRPSWRSHLRAVAAIARKDWHYFWRYPLQAVSWTFQPVIWLTPVYFMGQLFSTNGRAEGFAAYMADRVLDPANGIYSMIIAPTQVPHKAAEIIHKWAENPGFSAVCLITAGAEPPLGDTFYDPIYRAALSKIAERAGTTPRVLAVGDGLPTDITGANRQGFDVLFITEGIHAADLGPSLRPDPAKIAERLAAEGLRADYFMPRLAW